MEFSLGIFEGTFLEFLAFVPTFPEMRPTRAAGFSQN
jgi:hypothetical protein